MENTTIRQDGCVYAENGSDDLRTMALPTVFDPATIKNCRTDVQYGTLECQTLDIYYPESFEGRLPVLFYVHGGGWIMGNKREGALDCIIDAIHFGYAVISVDYRIAPHSVFPEFIFDVKTAVRWARAHAEEFGFDPDRFGMLGDSAGGHITLMMAFTEGRPEYEGEEYGWAGFSSGIQAALDMYGPSDLSVSQEVFYRESKVPRLGFGDGGKSYELPFGTAKPELLRLISPISLVHKNIPPLLIQQGYVDAVVAYQHSTLLKEKIDAVCGPDRAELRLYPDRNHSDKAFMTRENCIEVLEFFDKHLK